MIKPISLTPVAVNLRPNAALPRPSIDGPDASLAKPRPNAADYQRTPVDAASYPRPNAALPRPSIDGPDASLAKPRPNAGYTNGDLITPLPVAFKVKA